MKKKVTPKRRKTRAKAPATAKQMLNELRRFMDSAREYEKVALWKVLTALRGPDSGDGVLKEATTAVIRYHLFGKLGPLCVSVPDSAASARFRRVNSCNDHFGFHVKDAFEALDLNWGRIN